MPVTLIIFTVPFYILTFCYGAEVEKRMQFPGYTIPFAVGRDTPYSFLPKPRKPVKAGLWQDREAESRKAHTLENGGSNPPPAITLPVV